MYTKETRWEIALCEVRLDVCVRLCFVCKRQLAVGSCDTGATSYRPKRGSAKCGLNVFFAVLQIRSNPGSQLEVAIYYKISCI